jgi:obg-like ATPase 1
MCIACIALNTPLCTFWNCHVALQSAVSAYLEIWDIAGLVKGASKGEGLGNAFLSHISSVDGIFHVCR